MIFGLKYRKELELKINIKIDSVFNRIKKTTEISSDGLIVFSSGWKFLKNNLLYQFSTFAC